MTPDSLRIRQASWLITATVLLLVLKLHLLSALIPGLLVYELVHLLAPRLSRRLSGERAKQVALVLLATLIILGLVVAGGLLVVAFESGGGNFQVLAAKVADIIERARNALPEWLVASLPPNADALQEAMVDWLRSHAGELQLAGTALVRGLAHAFIGVIIGAILALREVLPHRPSGPLAIELAQRASRLADAFRRIVFAQVRISAINTTLTALYLWLLLPALGVHLPLVKTLIALTFVVGLLPVVGNLISNTAIVVVGLSHSPEVAIGSLAYLVVIHKLEYFLNARIIGSRIEARAWELLLAMLMMEAAFGISGLIAAPFYYAYLKDELRKAGLV